MGAGSSIADLDWNFEPDDNKKEYNYGTSADGKGVKYNQGSYASDSAPLSPSFSRGKRGIAGVLDDSTFIANGIRNKELPFNKPWIK